MSQKHRIEIVCGVFLWLLLVAVVLPVRADNAEAKVAIEQRVQSYVAAFNAGDAKAVAAHWSENAIYTSPVSGNQVTGRAAIEQEFRAILEGAESGKLKVEVASIEFVSPSVAIEQGTAELTFAGGKAERSTYSAVHVFCDGQWYLDRVTEKEVVEAPTHYQQLKQLEWLVGTWASADDVSQAQQKCWWTRNRNFIVRSFTIKSGGEIDLTGIQIIGWDAATKRIRSWAFDSDGGFANGQWLRKGDKWFVTTLAVLPDGRKGSSVNVLRKIDDTHFGWQATDRIVAGKLLPNVNEAVMEKTQQAASEGE